MLPKLALDLDGTLADLHSVILPEVSAETGKVITANMITSWKALARYTGKSSEGWRYEQVWDKYKDRVEVIQPYERGLDRLTERLGKVAEVDIVTAHEEGSREPISEWLGLYGVKYRELVIVPLKSNKEELCRHGIFVDDSDSLARRIQEKQRVRRVTGDQERLLECFLYDQPYNRGIENGNGVSRVRSLLEVVEILEGRAEA
ncbi:MAG: hypothetical protein HY362_04290 [Candidatus Aenigmarchaeota archaeon]|nr:hypothetical protein [Candidatus Aenigmarchaeota archaeon]